MAAILFQARRHCFSRTTPSQFSLLIRSHSSPIPSFPSLHRSLCSSSSSPPPQPNTETQSNDDPTPRPPLVQVRPISYPVKPIDPSPPPPPQQQQHQQDFSPLPPRRPGNFNPDSAYPVNTESENWTREDTRYVRDLSQVSPVSYQARVAPLPEDRPRVAPLPEGRPAWDAREDEAESTKRNEQLEAEWRRRNEQLEAERRRIEADDRVIRRPFRVDVEPKLPFPTLIKGQQNNKEKVNHDLKEAIQLVKANSKQNFEETLEAHVKLTPELRRTDLKLTGSVSLPHGAGKSLRVAVFAEGAHADEARAAGADLVGGDELIEEIKSGKVKVKSLDKCIATPQMMVRVGRQISKKLNRLTPNAKDGSVTTDISRAVKEAKQKTEFKKDKSAIVHVGLGKVGLTDEALCENVGAFMNALLLAKPAGLKKSSKYAGYVNTFHVCSTMGPAFPVSIQSVSIAADRYGKLQPR